MVKVAETTSILDPPGGAGGGEGGGGDGGGEGGGGEGGGEGGGGDGGGGEGALKTCDDVPTSLTEVMVTPRLVESWAVLPWSADVDAWAESSDGTMMETRMMVLPAVTQMVIR